uniref:Uncharacterized protein n=1 Tax=Arion vulgaris TaxID=1028688 RepID=A0A0B6ZWG9_9EUPU
MPFQDIVITSVGHRLLTGLTLCKDCLTLLLTFVFKRNKSKDKIHIFIGTEQQYYKEKVNSLRTCQIFTLDKVDKMLCSAVLFKNNPCQHVAKC